MKGNINNKKKRNVYCEISIMIILIAKNLSRLGPCNKKLSCLQLNERQYFKKFKFQFFLTFPPLLLTQISARFCIDPTALLTEKQDCCEDCRFLQLFCS